MILAEFINSKYYASKEEYSDLVDFHTHTSKDVYVYNDYTISDFNYDEWNTQLRYFLKYYRNELLKISSNLGEKLCPVVIIDGLFQPFKDIDSFEEYIKNDIYTTLFDYNGDKLDRDVKITLNSDSTISIIYYNDNKEDKNSTVCKDTNYILGYISKSTFSYLYSIPLEAQVRRSTDVFDLSLQEEISISKFNFNSDNEYYKTRVSIDIKDSMALSQERYCVKKEQDRDFNDYIPF